MFINILVLTNSKVYDQGEEERKKITRHKFYIYRDLTRAMEQLINIGESKQVIFLQK